jgi:hypothetical protein
LGVGSSGPITLTVTQAAPTFLLATNALFEGPAAGADSMMTCTTVEGAPWVASADVPWLHPTASGIGNTNLVFTFDANPGPTRTGTITYGNTLANPITASFVVTQAGTNYSAVNALTNFFLSNSVSRIAVNGSGNIYILTNASGFSSLLKYNPTNNSLTTLATNAASPFSALTADDYGNAYFISNNFIKVYRPATGSVMNLLPLQFFTYALALDPSGNLYFGSASYVHLWMASSNVVVSNLFTGVNPGAFATDVRSNLYVSDATTSTIKKWTKSTGQLSTVTSQPYFATSLAVDTSGNIFMATDASGTTPVLKWVAATGVPVNVTATHTSSAVTVDGQQNVYVGGVQAFTNTVNKIPHAFVATDIQTIGLAGGTQSLPVVLPPTQRLTEPFTPTNDQPAWFSIASVNNGIISYSAAANPGATNRTARIGVLGKVISITQRNNAAPFQLFGLNVTTNGSLQFSFTNDPTSTFTILSATNVALPLTNWDILGTPSNLGSGQFQYTTPLSTNDQQRYYRIRSP